MNNLLTFASKYRLKQNPAMSDRIKNEPTRVEHSGIAKLKYRELDVQVPESEIIIGGVDSFKD